MVAEMRRGIWETTGLFAEPQSPGWIAVSCQSRAMAEWIGAAIVLENVAARVEDDRVLLPAGPKFRLEDEVKSIVTVVAKTHHYWTMHEIAARSSRPITIGVDGSTDEKLQLIDALRRRYGRQRAVVASPAQAREVNDPAIDLVLVDAGEDGKASGFVPETVDATIVVGRDTNVDSIVSWLQGEFRLDPWRARREHR